MHNNYLQKYHIEPKKGWLNDPNGLCYINNNYEIFYQYSYEVNGGLKYWYHLSSKDLVNFEDKGIFLSPDSKFDKSGVYSGSCNIEDNKAVFYYTGNVKHEGDFDYIHLGREHNTIKYVDGEKIVILKNKDYPNMSNHVRDPKIIYINNEKYLILGARDSSDKGCLLVYKNNKYFKTIYYSKYLGYMWECPDIVYIKGEYFLIFSPQGIQFKDKYWDNKYQVGYLKIDENFNILSEFKLLDFGHDFYACQSFLDKDSQNVMFAWMYVPDSDYINDTVKYGYQNCLSIPRILDNINGKLIQKAHGSIKSLITNENLKDIFEESSWQFISKDKDFIITIDELEIKYVNESLEIDIEKVGCGRKNRKFNIKIENIEIYFDSSSFEIFINQGEFTFSSRYYPKNHKTKINSEKYIAKKMSSIEIKRR